MQAARGAMLKIRYWDDFAKWNLVLPRRKALTRPIFSAHAAATDRARDRQARRRALAYRRRDDDPVTTKPVTAACKEELAYTKYANSWLLAQTLQ
jgi:hypothetical protein